MNALINVVFVPALKMCLMYMQCYTITHQINNKPSHELSHIVFTPKRRIFRVSRATLRMQRQCL